MQYEFTKKGVIVKHPTDQHFYPSKVFFVRTMETVSRDWENVTKTFQGQLLMVYLIHPRKTFKEELVVFYREDS